MSLRDPPPNWLTDAKLQILHGNSRLRRLDLHLMETNITAAAFAGSVTAHPQAAVCLYPEVDRLTQPLWPCTH